MFQINLRPKTYNLKLFVVAFISVFVFASFLFVDFAKAAITINNFDVNGNSTVAVRLGDQMTHNWRITATKAEVNSSCGQNLAWSISRNDQVPPDRRVVASGLINADNFLVSTAQTGTGAFSFTPFGGQTSEALTLRVGCGKEPGTNILLRTLTRSSPVTINFTGQTAGAVSVNFDVNPKQVAPNTNSNFQFNLNLTAKQSDLDCRGGASAPVKWGIYKFPAAGRQDDFSSPNLVEEGAFTVSSFGATSPTTERVSFSKTTQTPNQDFVFKARISCDRLGGDELTTSSAVPIRSGGAGSGTGTCNNNGTCDRGETSFSCPNDCRDAAGQPQTFTFSLDNPLQAENILDLINIITTWLFMIAIPIAVVMIVWAGVIFLTSQGEPAKITKARQILLYAVVGLAIILIGKGFITLIESILNLGTP